LTIYDVAGRRITTLVDRRMSAGSARVQWNGYDSRGQRVASGVYFYRLVAGSTSETRKMVMLK
jgi:flagellar hook assembly protein FlgD